MAPHSSTLAWKIPWTEEPRRLQSLGSLRVRHDLSNLAAAAAAARNAIKTLKMAHSNNKKALKKKLPNLGLVI